MTFRMSWNVTSWLFSFCDKYGWQEKGDSLSRFLKSTIGSTGTENKSNRTRNRMEAKLMTDNSKSFRLAVFDPKRVALGISWPRCMVSTRGLLWARLCLRLRWSRCWHQVYTSYIFETFSWLYLCKEERYLEGSQNKCIYETPWYVRCSAVAH